MTIVMRVLLGFNLGVSLWLVLAWVIREMIGGLPQDYADLQYLFSLVLTLIGLTWLATVILAPHSASFSRYVESQWQSSESRFFIILNAGLAICLVGGFTISRTLFAFAFVIWLFAFIARAARWVLAGERTSHVR
ncbi:MAG: hypothetical protein OSA47_01660 [Novosphingopyxis baekryungensis]|jgi:hypothetical protein|nr:hypothetical protein [Novosphingopyxis baekryungensis]